MEILFIKGDDVSNVRLAKYIRCLTNLGHDVTFLGWKRISTQKSDINTDKCRYLLYGGGFGSRKLLLLYPIWMIKVFFAILFANNLKNKKIIAVNFDSALPTFLACKLRQLPFVYEIHDEFALSYRFPSVVKRCIRIFDHIIMRNSAFVIHVDVNRITYKKCRYIVIENSPEDYWKGNVRPYDNLTNTFAVIGNISQTRGIDQIYEFAKLNNDVKILLVGKFYDLKLKDMLLQLDNIEYHDYMPQDRLFKLMEKCCAIFSLYDPALEINRLAASNKVYDAMMMGIPVITNKDVINSKFIKEKEVGFVINYHYDDTWGELTSPKFIEYAVRMGRNGRKLYLDEYQFSKMTQNRLIPMLEQQYK